MKRKQRRRKYDLAQPAPEPLLSTADTKAMARLVGKYGRKVIAMVAKSIPLPKRGRPKKGALPVFERIDLAETLDEWIAEHRESGTRAPVTAAYAEAFELETGKTPDQNPRGFETYCKNLRKKLAAGRRLRARLNHQGRN